MIQGIRYEEDEIREQSQAFHAEDDTTFGHEETVVLYLTGSCGRWRGLEMHYDHDAEDKERAKQALLDRHAAEDPDCKEEPTFGYI